MPEQVNLLVIEDALADFLLIERRLRQDGLNASCRQAASEEELAHALKSGAWHAVLSDYRVPGMDFDAALRRIRGHDADLPVILVSGSMGEEAAVDLLKQGVSDFVLKDRLARLVPAIRRALDDVRRRRAQRESEAIYHDLFESIGDAIGILEEGGRILDVNQSASLMYGHSREKLIGNSVLDLAAPGRNDTDEVAEAIKAAYSGEPRQFEFWGVRANGKAFPQDVNMHPATYKGRRAVIGVARDITVRKRIEESKQQDQEQQAILRALLETTLSPGPMQETLEECLKKLLALSWLALLPKGGVFLMDGNAQSLKLAAARNLPDELIFLCASVALGRCYCGQTAAIGQVHYADCLDERHEATNAVMEDHGHYCLPLLSNGKALGALMLYLPPGYRHETLREQFIASAADILAGYVSRKQHEERLRLAGAAMESTHEGMVVTDLAGTIQAINPAFTQITGYSEAEILGRTHAVLQSRRHDAGFYAQMWASIKQTGHWQGEIWNRRKSGDTYPQWLTISTVRDERGVPTHYVGVFKDISQIKNAEERMAHLAHYDALTDLPNRLLLQTLLNHALDRAQREHRVLAVLFMDLDRFKHINDSLGHTAGDDLLRIVAARLKTRVRDSDTVARLGGDEFVMLLETIDNPNAAANVAEDIVELLKSPVRLPGGQEVYVGVSIGISIFPNDGNSGVRLIRNADAAMYRAKESGRNTYRFYTEDLTQRAQQRLRMEGRLRHALARGEFLLHFQPLVGNDRCSGVEALVRWQDPVDGLVSPMQFVPLAEETRLIVPLGEWVLRAACAQMKAWLEAGLALETMAVNLSPVQLQQPDFPHRVWEILFETGLPASCLELEITEGAIMEQGAEAEKMLAALHGQGIRLAIDDFGTGYSSLAYLRRFPIHKLKIDRSFVRDIPDSPAAMEIAATVIAMAKNLNLEVLAEGVETTAQFDFLRARGCDTYQGFLFSRPVPAESISDLMSSLGFGPS